MAAQAAKRSEGLTKVRLSNFKIHEKTDWIEIKPITLFVGPNSTGKSAFIQALLLLKQSIESGSAGVEPVSLTGRYVDLGSFRDLVFHHDTSRMLEIEISGRLPLRRVSRREKQSPTNFVYSVSISYDENRKRMILKQLNFSIPRQKIRLRYSKGSAHIELGKTKLTGPIEGEEFPHRRVTLDLGSLFLNVLRKNRVFDSKKGLSERYLNMYIAIQNSGEMTQSILRNLSYVGPIRVYPQRYYAMTGEKLLDVGVQGERAIELIHNDKATGGKMMKDLENWLKTLGVAKKADTRTIEAGLFAMDILDPHVNITVNVADVGFGVSQIVPIIVEGYLSPRGSTIILEQPEIHLHPRAQAILADLLLELARRGKKVLVETHSEHLLLRLQRRIAEGKINPGQVAVYYFEPRKGGVTVRRIEVDSSGQLTKFPKGFMEEGVEEAYRLALASSH